LSSKVCDISGFILVIVARYPWSSDRPATASDMRHHCHCTWLATTC
jgi:hypothetical protein